MLDDAVLLSRCLLMELVLSVSLCFVCLRSIWPSSYGDTIFSWKIIQAFDQLMGLLPPTSAEALPKHYKALTIDPNFSISDFYPRDSIV